MATDVARLSFDTTRLYRGVIPQQGRVSLEAEQNESRTIDGEERRAELIDIVGPAGTPDNGYWVSPGGGGTIDISAGTMYVGGWRVVLPRPIKDTEQSDWLDRSALDRVEGQREHVVLLVRETDVTAVEDPALYEVALGGPDGAARSRLLQRIVRIPTDGDDCATALAGDITQWESEGYEFDPATMQLGSLTRLQVTWEGDPQPDDPCEPSSSGGYLGAENQLIRVQIVQSNRDGTFDFLWGFDDASFLYRVAADESTNPVLTLDRTPVDDYHRPRAGQAMQVLRATAALTAADDTVEGYVAALGGEVALLTSPYDPDTKTVQFPAPLPPAYTDPAQTPQLFLRVWEDLVTGARVGDAISLPGTGLQITISSLARSGSLPQDDFWCIAVRPSTPTAVYPARYLREPQPPDGAREWVCPLAVIGWEREEIVVIDDCRHHFKPLVDLGASDCCTVEVDPSDADSGRLQELIDRVTAGRDVARRTSRVTICFRAGLYTLREPIVLRRRHSNITLTSCSEGAIISAHPDAIDAFRAGLVVLADVDNVSIRGLEFALPQVPPGVASIQGADGGVFTKAVVSTINSHFAGLWTSIGLRAFDCAELEVTDCLFRFSFGDQTNVPEAPVTGPRAIFGAAIFLGAASWGMRIERNRFLHHQADRVGDATPTRFLVGILQLSSAVARMTSKLSSRALGSARVQGRLDDATIVENRFVGIPAAVVVMASIGNVRVSNNEVDHCNTGILLVEEDTPNSFTAVRRAGARSNLALEELVAAYDSGLRNTLIGEIVLVGTTYPLPNLEGYSPTGIESIPADQVAAAKAAAQDSSHSVLNTVAERLTVERGIKRTRGAQPAPAVAKAVLLDNKSLAAARAIHDLMLMRRPVGDLHAALRVEQNVIDCSAVIDGATGVGLFVLTSNDTMSRSTATVSSNRVTSLSTDTVAYLVGATAATVTGNVLAAGRKSIALAVGNVGSVAITGNVMLGRALLPVGRPFPAPFDTWLPLNTIE
jgi:hypothetical protein